MMGLPITSAGGNFVVGAISGAVSTLLVHEAEDQGVGTLGQLGIGLGAGLPGALITRGQFMPYMGGVLAGWGAVELLTD
jgi:hypothetical protein